MGLGIFIARTLLAHQGASLDFSNDIGDGAVVEVRWPRASLEVSGAGGAEGAAAQGGHDMATRIA